MERRLHALEVGMTEQRKITMRWKRGFAVMSTLALMGVATAVVALTITSSSYSGLSGETVSYDSNVFTVSLGGVLVNALPLSAVGATVGSPVELDTASVGRTALGAGNWTYQVTAAEATDGSVGAGPYEAELFVNGTSKGSIFFEQSANAVGIEAIVLTWDIGADLSSGDSYTVRISS